MGVEWPPSVGQLIKTPKQIAGLLTSLEFMLDVNVGLS